MNIELGEKLGNKVTKVANDTRGAIENESDEVKGEIEDIANEVADFAKETAGEVEGELNKITDIIEDIRYTKPSYKFSESNFRRLYAQNV